MEGGHSDPVAGSVDAVVYAIYLFAFIALDLAAGFVFGLNLVIVSFGLYVALVVFVVAFLSHLMAKA